MTNVSFEGGVLDYHEYGEGAPLVLVHGSFATAHSWKQVRLCLEDSFHIYALNLPGYGASTPATGDDTALAQISNAIGALLEKIGEPVHLVGHSAGGFACLRTAIALPIEMKSLTLIEPTTIFALKCLEDNPAVASIEKMFEQYTAHIESGKKHAAQHVIDFWGGAGSYAAFPEKFYTVAEAMLPQNIREWRACFSDDLDRSAFDALSVPTQIICGDKSAKAMQQICANLDVLLPNSGLEMLPGASHFSPTTHASQIAVLISQHAKQHTKKARG